MAQLKQSTAYVRAFFMVDAGLTVSVALSKAGAAFAAAAGAVAAITDGAGWYKVSLTAGDTDTLGDLAFLCTASGADPVAFVDEVVVEIVVPEAIAVAIDALIPLIQAVPAQTMDLTDGVETDWTLRQALRVMLAALAGKLTGAAGTTVWIRNVLDSKTRITATVDDDGNRASVTYEKD